MKAVPTNVRLRRLELGLTQQQLAEAVGYRSRSAIAKIESGASEVPLSKLVPLARALDTTVERLLEGSFRDVRAGDSRKRTIRLSGPAAKVAAIVLAGGRSTRNLQNIPNQFMTILGKPVVAYCLEVYERHPMVDDIFIVCLEGYRDIMAACVERYRIDKVVSIVDAGETGAESAKLGYLAVMERGYGPGDVVVFQESTRPLVSPEMVTRVVAAAREKGSAITGEPMSDNVQFYRGEDGLASYLDRSRVIDLQSPDAHKVSRLKQAFELAEASGDKLQASNVGMLMYGLSMPVSFCEGPHGNVKIVRQEDLSIAAALLKLRA